MPANFDGDKFMTRPPHSRICRLVALLALAGLATTGQAQAPAAAPAKPAAAAKPAPKPAAKAPAKTTAAAPAKTLPAANADQLAAAAIAHLGDYPCELGENVHIGHTPKHEGYVDVRHKKATYTMKPVLSSTGALRLEDVHGRMLMLQIANKSMLMDVKAGQRVVDGCVHEKQRDAAAKPPGSSLGIEPTKP
jgi:hypothetical protein